jgi:arylsulfatase
MKILNTGVSVAAATALLLTFSGITFAQTGTTKGSKPNIVMIVSDDTGYWDLGPYLGGASRGMPTPSFNRFAAEGMMFTDFYAQLSCTPGRAAMQTGRFPNRSGMTTVAFQGQGGGLPAAEWTLASVLKEAGYATYFAGKWHLGEADYALPNAQGYDRMDNVVLYHLSAYTYGLKEWHPQMSDDQIAFFRKATKGILAGKAGEKAHATLPYEEMTTQDITDLDKNMMKNVLPEMARLAKGDQPFFMSVNFVANHNPNLPSADFVGASDIKNVYGDKVVELDSYVGQILDKIEDLGIAENTLVVYTVDNGAWQDVHPDSGMTPFRGSKGTDRDGGWRVPAMFLWKGKIKAGGKSGEIAGGLDLMATFAALAGTDLPEKDREGTPMTFDSHDMAPILFGEGEWTRTSWFYFTEQELSPGAIRVGPWKAVFNLRGDNGAQAGNDAPGNQLGWRGVPKYVATMPAVYNLWEDPQERYDIFMTTGRANDWTAPFFMAELEKVVKSFEEYPPRPMQSLAYTGEMTINKFRLIQRLRKAAVKAGMIPPH